ncbi:ribonuclease HI [Caldicellulosiruptor bescii]|uniref:Ribonuclease H n=2 Tax=Caldicellulosiruptor bescii TaxID=31899 RepID=B9MRY6_CALBD|nr:ribonuclease HI [Caldicellulosiruptor bescii]ACM60440.1 Ribonuclease H [Caldicellulosiruptor bescii DSM 6725]PBC87854.1 ribonuclease HI [Caldicellulosiruptor bescii]PBC90786.1 ribonuclease HI [Caldicellulosiruptor bescii]PBD03781.1 ribonuclease HI [Caldicellulosiruptor bescii]PBD06584.1 ribonuclease HI [Caldicellulosiruptor bescii]
MKEVTIYTDGACSGNPGPGGWCAILIYKGIKKVLKGFERYTTNNRMELKAVVEALKALKEPCKVVIYSDSAYIVNAVNQNWIEKWQKNGWKTSEKEEVKNIDLWNELVELMKIHKVTFEKVKGHADNELNNLCDRIARSMIKGEQ